ncbi:MAG: NUDIX domain-containing protein [Bacteroidota bacterium]
MEIWEILDKNRRKTGKLVERGKPMTQDEYHLVVHVWIVNSKGEFLIQKRAPNKTYPNMWDITGGSAILGDDSLQAALREVKEEIGIELSAHQGECFKSYISQNADFPQFTDVWLFMADFDISEVVCQPEVVAEAKWAASEEILLMIKRGEFVDAMPYLDEIFKRGKDVFGG